MEIPVVVISYISKYGYLAIFIMVLLQETGFPNPIPNELLLLFAGYSCYVGSLSFVIVIIIAFIADFTGTIILFHVFYFAGDWLMKYLSRRFPAAYTKIDKIAERIKAGGLLKIFIFRCTPFTRGYTSVITGLLKFPRRIYLPVAVITGFLWATFYVSTGYLTGPLWNQLSRRGDLLMPILILFLFSGIILILAFRSIRSRKQNLNTVQINSDNDEKQIVLNH
jgi:membrane protein DedA with SNARE-associated domain